MRINRSVTCGPCKVLIISVRNMTTCLVVSVPLSQAEINHVGLEGLLPKTYQEVVRLDVTMDEALCM